MTAVPALIQDLRAHAHEAPEHCAKLMREAATLIDRHRTLLKLADADPPPVRGIPIHPPSDKRRVKGAPCA